MMDREEALKQAQRVSKLKAPVLNSRIADTLLRVQRKTAEECMKKIEGSKMTECFIGPLYGAGWNGCIEELQKRIRAAFGIEVKG
jgi:hypothetical protein